jgi:hypothetical protein
LGVGALNVVLLAPVWMQLVHLALADTIWIGATWMILECLATGASESSASVPRTLGQVAMDASRAK